MFINLKTLLHLPVYTESGVHLGRIHDLEVEFDTHHVRRYIVEPRFFSKEYYLINPIQIKEITEEKIIVEDNVSKFEKGEEKKEKKARPALGGISPVIKEN